MTWNMMASFIKNDGDSVPIYLIVYLNQNMTIKSNIGSITSTLLNFLKPDAEIVCDQQTCDVLTSIE